MNRSTSAPGRAGGRVLFCFPISDYTGGAKMGLEVLRAFGLNGITPLAVCNPPPADGQRSVVDDMVAERIDHHVLPWRKGPKVSAAVIRLAWQRKVDRVVSIYQSDLAVTTVVSLALGIPLYVYDQNRKTFAGATWLAATKRFVYEVVSWQIPRVLFCISDVIVAEHRGMLAGHLKRVVRSSSGIDTSLYYSPTVRPAPAGPIFRFLNLARLDVQKGQHILVEAFARLRAIVGPGCCELLLAGAPTPDSRESEAYAADLRGQVQAQGLAEEVRFIGWSSKVRELLREAGAYVQSSLWEGWPLAVMEAMCSGVPAIFTDCAGLPAGYVDRRDAMVVKAGDAGALGEAMLAMYRMDADARTELGRQGAELAVRVFDKRTILDRLVGAVSAEEKWNCV